MAGAMCLPSTARIQIGVVDADDLSRELFCAALHDTGQVTVAFTCATGEAALQWCQEGMPDLIVLETHLPGCLTGIDTLRELRRRHPRLPVVLLLSQDDLACYQAFRQANIYTHCAFLTRTRCWLPSQLLSLFHEVRHGRSYLDPDIANRVEAVQIADARSPLHLLGEDERAVIPLLALGMTNQQIATHLGMREARVVSRINGQIYAQWGLDESADDRKVARVRAALVYQHRQPLRWDDAGYIHVQDQSGRWVLINDETSTSLPT